MPFAPLALLALLMVAALAALAPLAALAAAGSAAARATPDPAAPLTLRGAIDLALASSPEVAAAAAAVQGDQAGARLAADALRPGAEVSTTPGVGRGLPVAVAGRVPAVVSVDLHQSVYNTDLRSQGLRARARTGGTQAALERAREQVAHEVADLYGRCWSDEQLLAGAERRLAAYQAMAARAAALHGAARNTDLDLAQARLREARARLRRMEIAGSRDADLWELRRRLGLDAGAPLVLPDDPLAGTGTSAGGEGGGAGPDSAGPGASGGADGRGAPDRDLRAGALEAARAADPDLVAAARSIQLLERARQLRQGLLAQVTVDADAQYSRLSRANGVDQFYVKFREDDWSVALAVTVPLWSGGRLRDAAAQADAAIDRLGQQRRAREEQLEIEVHRATAALDQALAAGDLARQAAAVAEEDLRIAEALAAEGRANPDDLDSRQAALADSREDETRAVVAVLTARVRLLELRGELPAGLVR